MKKISLIPIALLLMLSQCELVKKDDDGSFFIGGVTYKPFHDSNGTTTEISDDSNHSMQLFFKVAPGNMEKHYKIVDEAKAAHNTLADDEVAIQFNIGANDVYLSTGLSTDSTITISETSANLIILTVPPIAVAHYAGASALDTTTASAKIIF